MTFELAFFETLIHTDKQSDTTLTTHNETQLCDAIRRETQRIKRSLRKQALAEPESRIHFLITHHQAALTNLSDTLTARRQRNGILFSDWDDQLKQDADATASAALLELLSFLHQTFPTCVDPDQNLPRIETQRAAVEVHAEIGLLRAIAAEKKLDPVLLHDVLSHADALTQYAGSVPLSYRTLRYIRAFNEALLKGMLRAQKTGEADTIIQNVAIYFNCNTYRIQQYFIRTITGHDNITPGIPSVDRLQYWQKHLRQAIVRPATAFNPAMPALRDQLLLWIEEELLYQLQSEARDTPQIAQADTAPKLQTSLSVDQLGALIRMLVDNGIITTKNKKQVIAFFARHFAAIQQPNISAENLRVCYYRVEASTYQAMRNISTRLLSWLPRTRIARVRPHTK